MRRKHADFYREVSPPDSLSSLSNGSPVSNSESPDGTKSHSALPNGEVARNIGRPSPDSPNLKYRNLDRADAYGRTPAEGQDFGYVHDSGSGSARVIPYDSGFTNNSSAMRKAKEMNMRKAGLIRPPQEVLGEVTAIVQGAFCHYVLELSRNAKSEIDLDDIEYLKINDFSEQVINLDVEDAESVREKVQYLEELIFMYEDLKLPRSAQEKVDPAVRTLKDFLRKLESFDTADAFDLEVLHEEATSEIDYVGGILDKAKGYTSLIQSGALQRYTMLSSGLGFYNVVRNGDKHYVATLLEDTAEELELPLIINVYFSDNRRRANGTYKEKDGQHYVSFYFDEKPEIQRSSEFGMGLFFAENLYGNEELRSIHNTVRHELVHAMQTEIEVRQNVFGKGGMPTGSRGTKFRQDMRDEEREMRDEFRRKGLDPDLVNFHSLDDIEFYTRLLDAIVEFRHLTRFSRRDLNDQMARFLKASNFFRTLKHFQKKKWKKAVGIFTDETLREQR